MFTRRMLTVAMVALAVSGGCATAPTDDGRSRLFGDDGASFWTLLSFHNGLHDPDAIVQIEGESLSLDVPGFRRSWPFRYEANVIRFATPSSERSSNREVPAILAAFYTTMPKVKGSRVEGNVLSMVDANGRLLFALKRFTATGLENRKWFISQFFDGQSLVSTQEKVKRPFPGDITFVHGWLQGSPGCGGFIGGYSLLDQRVTIWPTTLLSGYCPDGEVELSDVICNALAGERVMEKENERLVLRDTQGRVQIVLTPWETRES